MSKTYLTAKELAKRWRMSPQTLAIWRLTGKGPEHNKMSYRVRYDLDKIEEFEKNSIFKHTTAFKESRKK